MGLVIAEVYRQLSKPVSRDFGNPWHIDAWIDAAGRIVGTAKGLAGWSARV
jgi:hypothetical protein